ncbi:sensor histidine kinase [Tuwongella immobilis]|uniref:histidine kinase n=1 Tax=Tuwongella immobilis TaxID=692036 RepID=A0A6C2YHH6_9BACT|nr:ATP-binding protein [Tuwongella immobilis]VIP00978.1 histidine kinase : Sensor protein FixL OS=Afipia felis GN=fixL_3 PE=4 SV=1: HisKA: HATPase_c [Tuwongella immobilis]VTR97374.1 histidine kinase : Sensor protein FixL OS=Afipia felis GN=fixL_3 PE=4 SV=1: HisKA: HATPase_c [Tuwongella immobilis]
MGSLLSRSPLAGAIVLVVVVFLVDLSLPLGVASAVPYTFAVLLALKARSPWAAPVIAAVCGVLTFAKMGIVPERGSTEMWKVITNRCLAIFAIGMTTLLGILRRQAEQRAHEHEASLAHLGRLSLLGQIAAGLAHELNQPLAAISLQADLANRFAEQCDSASPELTAALLEITQQSGRAADIIRSVRRLARRTEPKYETIPLNELVAFVVQLCDWQARRKGIQLLAHPSSDAPMWIGDRTQIEQVLLNLVQNAMDATTERPSTARIVTISVTRSDDAVRIRVRDSGTGVREPERLFQQFYTTKPDGMGLGLSLSRSLMEYQGGKLELIQTSADGSEFAMIFPRNSDEE